MIVGILADTHGHGDRARRAVALLKRLGAEAFIHCGDVGGEAVLDALAGTGAAFVWGNTDIVDPALERYAAALGLNPPHGRAPLVLSLGGKTLHVYHGHEPAFVRLDQMLMGDESGNLADLLGGVDYVLHGHTHLAANVHFGALRLINPGALHRAKTYSVATLDLAEDRVDFWVVDDRADPLDRPRQYHPR